MFQSTNETSNETRPTTDDRHRVLTEPRRRRTLDVLATAGTPVGLDSLAEAVAVAESDGGTVQRRAVDRVALTLHHCHLPLMADVGVVDYDTGAKQVTDYAAGVNAREFAVRSR